MSSPVYRGEVRAPDFPPGLDWLNTGRPLRLTDVRGKIVLLDFWTSCCINCIHVVPHLRRLERKYKDELVVIGVHTPKFTAERDSANILGAILRYGIEHPVVNDCNFDLWQSYAVRGWPTIVVVDPEGKVVGSVPGEGVYDTFDRVVASMIADFGARALLKRGPLAAPLTREAPREELYAFPGKVLADEAGGRLFIADSNKNRIVVASLPEGRVLDVVAGGPAGLADGAFEEARMSGPQGMALDRERLYIADTENHAVRVADLRSRSVTTLAGTGAPAPTAAGPPAGARGREVALNSPWDVVVARGLLFVAMAGSHQIWRIDPATGDAAPHAGSGSEARVDGPLREAALAQPSGIATDGERLYFADSESSAIRAAAVDPGGAVETIVGIDLFTFGDRDGMGDDVRLQHPLGVAWRDGALYIADTYNNKIKRLDPRARRCETILGCGDAAFEDNPDGRLAYLNQPGGVTAFRDRLYIADTNNHAIRVASLESGALLTFVAADLSRFEHRAV
jgi:thiol-disulfide isomerase/thioredoxin